MHRPPIAFAPLPLTGGGFCHSFSVSGFRVWGIVYIYIYICICRVWGFGYRVYGSWFLSAILLLVALLLGVLLQGWFSWFAGVVVVVLFACLLACLLVCFCVRVLV